MNQLNPQEIERRLANTPAPPPPSDLLQKIQEEIPEPAEVWAERPSSASNRRGWLIAASLVVAVGGGLLGYRTFVSTEVDDLGRSSKRTTEATLPSDDVESKEGRTDADKLASNPLQNMESASAPPEDDAARQRIAESLTLGYLDGTAGRESPSASDVPRPSVNQIPVPDPRPTDPLHVADTITVTSEAPVLDERKVSTGATISKIELEPKRRRKQSTSAREAELMVSTVAEPTTAAPSPPPSTGGTAEPNDQPYGDVFYREYGVNPFLDTEDDRYSTFGLDVDTGSYSITRRYLDDGNLPPREAIRIEEFLNYFDYGDAPPERGDFALHSDLAPAPFATGKRYQILRFGIRGREVSAENRKPATLIFVVDVSGSMNRENRLGLVISSLERLLDQLRADDRVGLVIYGSRGQVLLEPTGDHGAIRRAVQSLHSGGSTNAEEGLGLAYDLATRHFRPEAINRIILCSDGVANVGATGPDSILSRVRREAERGIELTTVGFGMGNYNDVLMERLADDGDGNYAYVDDLAEANRIFVENLTGTLQTIAGDAKVQVEFNPETVSRYRLLGYENRDIADDRFRDDTVDAGEIGAGHSVVALYEIKLKEDRPRKAPLATLHLRYRSKSDGKIVEVERAVRERDGASSWKKAPDALKLAAAVAEFGEILKGSYWAKDGDLTKTLTVAQEASAGFAGDQDVAELVGLVAKAAKLSYGPAGIRH